MNRRSFHPVFIAILLAGTTASRAVDPLPPDIENAAEDVRLAYIERTARESEERKIEVGIRRHEERMKYKSQLAHNQRVEAMERLAQRRTFATADPRTGSSKRKHRFGKTTSIFAASLIVGLVLVWTRYRRSLNA